MSETVRVLAVRQFEHLNLQLDTELQELISMASEICNTPIALITLLDEDTQWIKVRKGISAESSPRAASLCTYAIQDTEVFIIADTLTDERFANHPLVKNGLRFYAAAPLITREGLALGTLCVADKIPHTLDSHQQMMLKMLSKQAINIMELKLSYEELEKKKREGEEQKETILNAEIRLRSFFESSANLHVLLGKNGEVLDYNKAAYRFVRTVHSTKLTRGDIFLSYLAPDFVSTFIEKFDVSLSGEKTYAEGSTDYGELGIIWWEANFEPPGITITML